MVDGVTGGDGRQRSLLSPTMASPQLDRHSAPSRIGRGHLPPPPPPPDVIQSLPASPPPDGRTSNTCDDIPPAVPAVTSRRTAESSPRAPPRTDLGLARRTYKARPAVDSVEAHGQQAPSSPVHARYSDTVTHLQEDGFAVCDFPCHMTDDRCW